MQATNYTSKLNRRAKSLTQRWKVRVMFADPAANVEYQYRTEAGAQAKASWYRAAMNEPRKYGYQDYPITGVELMEAA
jgi:hypothetical protein